MRKFLTRPLVAASCVAAAAAVLVAGGAASPPGNPQLTSVPTPASKAIGYAPASKLSVELQQMSWAQGSTKLENPQGIISFYGYENDVPSTNDPTVPQMVPTPTSQTEAIKTEPDKNTYLVFKRGLAGADPGYNYGTHFLFQGHENGARDTNTPPNQLGYVTRINLDADAAHRVTLLATNDTTGRPLPTIDGSTWEPWAQRVLLTSEFGTSVTGGVWAVTPNYPATLEDVSGALGRGGYEGIQDDSDGNIWLVEDVGGSNKPGTTARQPNSFVYRYVPRAPGDLHNGKLQALQVLNSAGQPITFTSQAPLMAPDQVALHSYGNVLDTRWITIHDTAVQGTAPFPANALAKAADATPFKRPENGVFRPGTKFREFYFTETGDTNATSAENGDPITGAGGAGGWGGIQMLVQSDPSANTGTITVFFQSKLAVTGLDNIQFLSRNLVSPVEDAGDTLHTQRKALDSGYVLDTTLDYSNAQNQPLRWLAEGRDASATIDSANGGFGKNDQDNEITGIHVSDGDPGTKGMLGAKVPQLFDNFKWRWFYTQQHGDNNTYEVVPNPAGAHAGEGDFADEGGARR
jgi:hypothetical protein